MNAHAPAIERPAAPASNPVRLPITVRRADGAIETHNLSPRSHQELHLRALHSKTLGLVEIAAGYRDENGELLIYTRKRASHFLPGGGSGDPHWLERLMTLVDFHYNRGDEIFVSPATHIRPSANKEDIHWSRWAWVDIDGPEHLGRLDALTQRKPAAIRVISGGSGGEHAYWPLAKALPMRTVTVDGRTIVNPVEVTQATKKGGTRPIGYKDRGSNRLLTAVQAIEWIERSNLRLIHALGQRTDGEDTKYIADIKCRNRSRLMRLAGTVHGETGEHATLSYLDLRLAPYDPKVLLGDLEDTTSPHRARRRRGLHRFALDPYRQIPTDVYFWRIAGIELPARGNISCPAPDHPDVKPSCHVSDFVFYCHADCCDAQGTYIDLQSLMEGGPTGDHLAADSEAFKRAKRNAQEAIGAM